MREIKFRCFESYDLETYEMVYSDKYKSLSEYVSVHGLCESHMQFTGIQDKNGIDIYEGDIVEIISFYPPSYTHENYRLNTVIELDSYHLRLIDKSFVEIEIIGNIHSNPELLESK